MLKAKKTIAEPYRVDISNNPLKTLQNCGGYYECPKGEDGIRFGPIVGYTGTYEDADGTRKQWVGDVYANFAKAEEYPHVLEHFAVLLSAQLEPFLASIDAFCGAPLGGYAFAHMLGLVYARRVIKAEKKVTALATKHEREKNDLIFARHAVEKKERVAIVEDVCNNFSTTQKLISLIEQSGGSVPVIICLLNRSCITNLAYVSPEYTHTIPVISLVHLVIPEYQQDDPSVADDVTRGNVVWKPKDEWQRLMTAMEYEVFKSPHEST
jgi:orotate phosphoribosyltransferase